MSQFLRRLCCCSSETTDDAIPPTRIQGVATVAQAQNSGIAHVSLDDHAHIDLHREHDRGRPKTLIEDSPEFNGAKHEGFTNDATLGTYNVEKSQATNSAHAHDFTINDSTFYDHTHVEHQHIRHQQHTHYHAAHTPSPDDVIKELRKHVALGASFNAAERGDPPKCHPMTRKTLLTNMSIWFHEDSFEPSNRLTVFTGSAGWGKTAVLQTAAEQAQKDGILAASFFFWAQSSDRSFKDKLVPTLAYQLTVSIPDLKSFIASAFAKDPTIVYQTLESQMKALLVDPIQKALKTSSTPPPWPRVIIIDGLDECRSHHDFEKHQKEILRAIASTLLRSDIKFPFHIFLSTRPEIPAREALETYLEGTARSMVANDLKEETQADVQDFIKWSFDNLRRTHASLQGLAQEWPSNNDLSTLIARSGDHFIYPTIVFNYLGEERGDPIKRLKIILGLQNAPTNKNPLGPVDALYSAILTRAQKNLDAAMEEEGEEGQHFVAFYLRAVIHAMSIGGIPECIKEVGIDAFFRTSPGTFSKRFCDVHSIWDIRKMGAHHRSLVDYLEDPDRCQEHFIPQVKLGAHLLEIHAHHLIDDHIDPTSKIFSSCSYDLRCCLARLINDTGPTRFPTTAIIQLSDVFGKCVVDPNLKAPLHSLTLTQRGEELFKTHFSLSPSPDTRKFITLIDKTPDRRGKAEWVELKLRMQRGYRCLRQSQSQNLKSIIEKNEYELEAILTCLDKSLSIEFLTNDEAAIYERLTGSKPPSVPQKT